MTDINRVFFRWRERAEVEFLHFPCLKAMS